MGLIFREERSKKEEKMKKSGKKLAVLILGALLAAAMAFAVTACTQDGSEEETLTAPTITLSSDAALGCLAGETVTLPAATAESCDGDDLTDRIQIQLSDPDSMTLEGVSLTMEEEGTYTVTYTVSDPRDAALTATASVTVNVVPLTAPTIELSSSAALECYAGGTVTLPSATAESCEGNDLTDSIRIQLSDTEKMSLEGSLLTVSEQGSYTVTYTVTDPRGTDLTATASVTVNVLARVAPTLTLSSSAALGCLAGGTVTLPSATAEACDGTDLTAGIQIQLSDTGKMSLEGSALTISEAGEYTVTFTVADNIDGSLTDSETVSVSVDPILAPTVTLSSEEALSCLEGGTVTLPSASAETFDGTDITSSIKIQLSDPDGMDLDGTTLTMPGPGEYNVTYTVSDPRDAGQTDTAVVTVNVYRDIIAYSDGSWSADLYAAEAEQELTSTNTGFTFVQFNMEASTLYYAEVTFTVSDPSGSNLIGMGHFAPSDGVRWLGSTVDRGDRNFNMGDFDTNISWNWGENLPYAWQLANYRGLSDPDAGKATYAIARLGDYFYSFLNGQYIACITLDYYREIYTVPGIFGHALNTSVMSGIVYCTGSEAQAKAEALLQGNAAMISAYSPNADEWSGGSLNEGNFTVNPVSEQRGVNFDFNLDNRGFNDGMVSPYLYFDGDFTFQWEYKNTSATTGGENPRMILEVRPWDYGSEVVQFGGDYGSDRRFLFNVPGFANESDKWDEKCNGFDDSQGARFTITRRVMSDHAEYTMTATSIADPSQTYTRTIQWSGDRWNETVLMLWHNTNVAGQYSNIEWSIEAEDITSAITNGSF